MEWRVLWLDRVREHLIHDNTYCWGWCIYPKIMTSSEASATVGAGSPCPEFHTALTHRELQQRGFSWRFQQTPAGSVGRFEDCEGQGCEDQKDNDRPFRLIRRFCIQQGDKCVIDDANDGGQSALSSDANKLDLCTAIQPGIADWAATCTEMAQHTNKLQIQNAVLQTILCGGCRGSPAPHPVSHCRFQPFIFQGILNPKNKLEKLKTIY